MVKISAHVSDLLRAAVEKPVSDVSGRDRWTVDFFRVFSVSQVKARRNMGYRIENIDRLEKVPQKGKSTPDGSESSDPMCLSLSRVVGQQIGRASCRERV